MNKAPILIFAMGNPSRGDDAFGAMLAEQLVTWLNAQAEAVQASIELINDQQLMVEHVMDMRDRGMVLFIDAAMQSDETLALTAVHPMPAAQATLSVNSHRCTPTQLLGLYHAMLLCAPPPAHLLSLKGHSYELGEPLSPQAQAGMPQAFELLHQWLNDALIQVAPNITGRPHA